MSYPYHSDHPNATGPDTVESTPELPELQQESMALDVKGRVEVVNAVRTYELPSRRAISRSYKISEGIATPLGGADDRRKRMLLIGIAPSGSASIGFYVGSSDDVRAQNAALWPYNQPLPVTHTEQIYVMPQGTSLADGHYISFVTENWAD